MRRDFPGPFRVLDLGGGAWRLTRTPDSGLDIYLHGAAPNAARVLQAAANALSTVNVVNIDWRGETTALTAWSGTLPYAIDVQSAIVHEPRPHLYEKLPLVELDRAARRFWRRVFTLMRIPGGRYLLRFLARRGQGRG